MVFSRGSSRRCAGPLNKLHTTLHVRDLFGLSFEIDYGLPSPMPSNSERFSDLPLSFVLAVMAADDESFDIATGDAIESGELVEHELDIAG
jgi:hypothetical protein